MRASIIALFVLPMSLNSATSSAEDGFATTYEVSWRGSAIGRFHSAVSVEGDDYRISYLAETTGILGWLFDFSSQGVSSGLIASGTPVPLHYEGQSRWRRGDSHWRIRFASEGAALEIDIPPDDLADRDPVPPDLRKGPDPLSLAFSAIGSAEPSASFEATSFDGKRAVHYSLTCEDETEITLPAPAIRPGSAMLQCHVEGKLLAGAHKKWKERGIRAGGPTTIWLARNIAPQGWWPVKLETPTSYGVVTVSLSSLGPEPVAPHAEANKG